MFCGLYTLWHKVFEKWLVSKQVFPLSKELSDNKEKTEEIFNYLNNFSILNFAPSFNEKYAIGAYLSSLIYDTETVFIKKEKFLKCYFITTTFLVPKNHLDRKIQEAFQPFEHKIIAESKVPQLAGIYQKVLKEYKDNKGKAHVEFSFQKMEADIHIYIGERTMLWLTKIEGEI